MTTNRFPGIPTVVELDESASTCTSATRSPETVSRANSFQPAAMKLALSLAAPPPALVAAGTTTCGGTTVARAVGGTQRQKMHHVELQRGGAEGTGNIVVIRRSSGGGRSTLYLSAALIALLLVLVGVVVHHHTQETTAAMFRKRQQRRWHHDDDDGGGGGSDEVSEAPAARKQRRKPAAPPLPQKKSGAAKRVRSQDTTTEEEEAAGGEATTDAPAEDQQQPETLIQAQRLASPVTKLRIAGAVPTALSDPVYQSLLRHTVLPYTGASASSSCGPLKTFRRRCEASFVACQSSRGGHEGHDSDDKDEDEGDKVEYVRHNPAGADLKDSPGTLLLFHGCGHSARDFCMKPIVNVTSLQQQTMDDEPFSVCSVYHRKHKKEEDQQNDPQRCQHRCLQLPEEMRVVSAALELGFVVIAVSSKKSCWNMYLKETHRNSGHWYNKDFLNVAAVLLKEEVMSLEEMKALHLQTEMEPTEPPPTTMPGGSGGPQVAATAAKAALSPMSNKPIFAFGASSGGSFAALVPRVFGARIKGIVVQISGASVAPVPFPIRIVYSTMERDAAMMSRVGDAVSRVSSPMSACQVVHRPKALTEDFLESHLLWPPSVAAGSDALKQLADSICAPKKTGPDGAEVQRQCGEPDRLLLSNSRRSSWRRHVKPWQQQSLQALVKASSAQQQATPPASEDAAHQQRFEESLRLDLLCDKLKDDKSPVSEVMNVAYAQHEFTSEHIDTMLQFLLGSKPSCT